MGSAESILIQAQDWRISNYAPNDDESFSTFTYQVGSGLEVKLGKKRFNKLIKRASTPVPKEQDKQLHPESYSGKKTRSSKTEDTSAKRRDKSRR